MGQAGPQGERGDEGRQGQPGPAGIGIKFINYDATTGNLKITKTDDSVALETNIRGPRGLPGNYTEDQIANSLKNDTNFKNNLASSLAQQGAVTPDFVNSIGSNLSGQATFQNTISSRLVSSGSFATAVGNSISNDQTARGLIVNELGNLVTDTNIAPIVSPRTIWCSTGANSMCSLPTTGSLHIPTGYNSEGTGNGNPIVLSQNGGYKHFIRTRHKNAATGNAIDFYLNNSTELATSSGPGQGNANIMSLTNTGVNIQTATRTGTHASNAPLYVTGDIGADSGIEFRHSNGTQGIGFGFNTIYATGSVDNQDINIKSKGTGNVNVFGNLKTNGGYFATTNSGIIIGDNQPNTSKWIFHAPNDNRRTLFIAPWNDTSNDWDWGKQMTIDNSGNVNISGKLTVGGQEVVVKNSWNLMRSDKWNKCMDAGNNGPWINNCDSNNNYQRWKFE